MDELLVGGTDDKEHLRNLEGVFKQFQKEGLRVKLPCSWHHLWYTLGCVFPRRDFNQLMKRSRASRMPLTPWQNYIPAWEWWQHFIPKLSTLAHPLNELLRDKPWNWMPKCEQAFHDVKYILAPEIVLTHYSPRLPVKLSVDASPNVWVLTSCTCIPMAQDLRLPTRRGHWTNMRSSMVR